MTGTDVNRCLCSRFSLLLILLAAAGGCTTGTTAGNYAKLQRAEYTEIYMSMPVRIVLYAHPDSAADAARAAFARIAELDDILSDYRPESEVSALRMAAAGERNAGDRTTGDRTAAVGIEGTRRYHISPDLTNVLATAIRVAGATNGAFDPTVYPLVALWREARSTGALPSQQSLDSARRLVGYKRISLDSAAAAVEIAPGTQFDLGAVAKGYILAEAARVLTDRGVTRWLIEAGGDMIVGDSPPDKAGWQIEAPGAPEYIRDRVGALKNAAFATSGPASQHIEIDGVQYSHVVDPRTGWALRNSATSWVIIYTGDNAITADAATADALATAFTVMQYQDSTQIIARSFNAIAAVVQLSNVH